MVFLCLFAAPAVRAETSGAVPAEVTDDGTAQKTPADVPANGAQVLEVQPVEAQPAENDATAQGARVDEKIKSESANSGRKEMVSKSDWDAYPIHAGDKIKIMVHGEKELSDTYTVDVKGDIHFPLIEKIHAEGLSLNDFREDLRAALAKDYLTNPQVEMTFEESIFNSVTILGYVNKPGNYILPPKMTFLRMISIAGGFTQTAAYSVCKVVRTDPDGSKSAILVDVDGILNGKTSDMELKPGDVVFVPKIATTFEEKDDYVNSVAVLGAVQKPGNYRLSPGMNIMRLLSQAGGLVRGADGASMTITRRDASGKAELLHVNMGQLIEGTGSDLPLRQGDVIYVPGLGADSNVVDRTHAVTILGQVQKPGNFNIAQGITLVQLISEAGGFTPVANSSRVRVTRVSGSSKQILEFNVGAILDGKIADVTLETGDIVYVPESVF